MDYLQQSPSKLGVTVFQNMCNAMSCSSQIRYQLWLINPIRITIHFFGIASPCSSLRRSAVSRQNFKLKSDLDLGQYVQICMVHFCTVYDINVLPNAHHVPYVFPVQVMAMCAQHLVHASILYSPVPMLFHAPSLVMPIHSQAWPNISNILLMNAIAMHCSCYPCSCQKCPCLAHAFPWRCPSFSHACPL